MYARLGARPGSRVTSTIRVEISQAMVRSFVASFPHSSRRFGSLPIFRVWIVQLFEPRQQKIAPLSSCLEAFSRCYSAACRRGAPASTARRILIPLITGSKQNIRSDLHYRLNVFPSIFLLCGERPENIPLLVQHFVQEAIRRMDKTIDTIPPETLEALIRYRWPDNIRELDNIIERAVILSPGPVLGLSLRDLKSRLTAGQSIDCH